MNQRYMNQSYFNVDRPYENYVPNWFWGQTGFSGQTGLDGQINPTQTKEQSGISVIASGITTAVADEAVIPLNALRNGINIVVGNRTNISFDAISHTIIIKAKGNYYVSWGAVVDGITGVGTFLELTLVQSYNNATPITNESAGNMLQGQLIGNTIITVEETPAVLSLLNTSGYEIDLAQVTVQAWMNVFALNGTF